MFSRLAALSHWQRAVLVVGLLVASIDIGVATYRRTHSTGDFDVRCWFGRRLVDHQPLYEGLLCFNYMPIFALWWAPVSLLPAPVGNVLHSIAALVCLGLTLNWLAKMTAWRSRSATFPAFTIGALTVLLAFHYLLRDLDDAGPHIIWLGLMVGGLYAASKGRLITSAASMALPIAVKITPGLILPMLVWKRQWRLAAYTSVATAAWIVLPAVWMGPSAWFDAQQQWNRVALGVASDTTTTERFDNEVRVQNQALKPAIQRLLVTYPAGHPLKLDHSWDVPLANFSTRTANVIATVVMAAICAAFAWWSRKPYRDLADARVMIEFSAVYLLVLLFSPLTWVQHMVFALPALYLIVAQDWAFTPLKPWARVLVWTFAIVTLCLNRELLGKQNYLLLLSYHAHTFCLLAILAIVMIVRPTADRESSSTAPIARPHAWDRRKQLSNVAHGSSSRNSV
jgi:alpha-1,2-mannosyltransferase